MPTGASAFPTRSLPAAAGEPHYRMVAWAH
jgi:hypothetical protein